MQQQSPNLYFYLAVALFLCLVLWLGQRLLAKWHPFYQRRSVKYSYWLLSVAAVTVIPLGRYFRPSEGYSTVSFQFATYALFSWIIGLVLLMPVMFILHSLRLLWLKTRQQTVAPEPQETASSEAEADNNLSRRDFLKGMAVAAPMASWAFSAGGVLTSETYLAVQRHKLSFASWPNSLSGFTIAQISDTHIGPYFDMGKLERLLATVEQEKPDLVVITGDLIDDLNLLPGTMERLNRFVPSIPHGVYYCWGNHEYFRDINRIRQAWKTSPVKVLENASIRLMDGIQPVYLLGVDYPWASKKDDQQAVRRSLLSRALSGVPDNAFRLLIAHHPDFLDNSFENNIDLTLTGHTHGGQVALFGRSLLPVQYKYMRGMYENTGRYGYVNVGAGHWLPFRLGVPAEVAFFTLSSL